MRQGIGAVRVARLEITTLDEFPEVVRALLA